MAVRVGETLYRIKDHFDLEFGGDVMVVVLVVQVCVHVVPNRL